MSKIGIGWIVMCLGMALSGPVQAQFSSLQISILDLEAPTDSNRLSTAFVQRAIDSCYHRGGGTVRIPQGTFKIGTIVLKSNVCLHLDSGAVLKASRNIQDYRLPVAQATRPIMIYANGAENIRIEGKGVIYGNVRHVYEDLREVDAFIKNETEIARKAGVEMKRYYIEKPDVSTVQFVRCDKVELEDFSIRSSVFWSLHLLKSQNIIVNNLNIKSSLERGVNADGIDINLCRNVVVTNCRIETGDDGIVVKSWDAELSENIEVSNCWISSSSTALKIGTETKGDFKNVSFSNCEIVNANRGLSIVIRDGAKVDGVRFSNITIDCRRRHFNWWGNADPIWVYLDKRAPASREGSIQNVVFENISAVGMGTSRVESKIDGGVKNLLFQNVSIKMMAEDKPDKRADHALVFRNVSDVVLNNLTINWDELSTEPKWGSAVVVEEVTGISLNNINARQGLVKTQTPVIAFHNTQGVSLTGLSPMEGAVNLISIEGAESGRYTMQLVGDVKGVRQKLIVGDAVSDVKSINLLE